MNTETHSESKQIRIYSCRAILIRYNNFTKIKSNTAQTIK